MTCKEIHQVGFKILSTYVNEQFRDKKDAPFLDIGAGTGLLGQEVGALSLTVLGDIFKITDIWSTSRDMNLSSRQVNQSSTISLY